MSFPLGASHRCLAMSLKLGSKIRQNPVMPTVLSVAFWVMGTVTQTNNSLQSSNMLLFVLLLTQALDTLQLIEGNLLFPWRFYIPGLRKLKEMSVFFTCAVLQAISIS